MSNYPERPVAVLFSGGDSPGMNALLRAIARLGLNRHGVAVFGIREGYRGLLRAARLGSRSEKDLFVMKQEIASRRGRWGLIHPEQDIVMLDHASVSGIVGAGGTMLGSARCLDFKKPGSRAEAVNLLKNLNVRALIVCGGDGSLAGAECLTKESDIRVIGVPCTIDNDLFFTEMAIGVDTAVGTLVWAVDHFKDTARSHKRIMVLETMGAKRGELARLSAIASGAEMVITPEGGPVTMDQLRKLAESIKSGMEGGRSHTIVLVAEGVQFEPEQYVPSASPDQPPGKRNRAYVLADYFQTFFHQQEGELKDLEVRPSVLGHLQRGGHATPQDCILAARFAELAWNSIMDPSERSGITALRNGRVELVPFGAPDMPERAEMSAEFSRLHASLSSW
ncbi:MAG: 6-phosphofructokinase [Verrucomicrobiaceae bacterium]|nr:6-phosphofructokinase [Verrucomicrobiaceae bacterium]